MKPTRKETGNRGELLAADHAAGLGYRVLAANWRCRSGEIDLIAQDGDTVVFIEVRTRRQTGTFGTPQESVDARKQRQVRETALVYLHQCKKHESKVRFDVIAVHLDPAGDLSRIEHLPNAF